MLYIMYNTERFSYKSGRAMRFAKRSKETGLQCYSKNFGLKQLYSYYFKKVLSLRHRNMKSVCIPY